MDEAYNELVKEALLRKLSGAKTEAVVSGVKRIGGAIASGAKKLSGAVASGAKKFGAASQEAMHGSSSVREAASAARRAEKKTRVARNIREHAATDPLFFA